MNKSDKIREYFRKHPDANVTYVATKFQAPKPMTYKLRKQVQDAWQPPELMPMPELIQEEPTSTRPWTSGPRTTASSRTVLH